MLSLASNLACQFCTFDVKGAFRFGKSTRGSFTLVCRRRASSRQFSALIELLNGLFALRGSPRLRWRRLCQTILAAGFEERRSSPATLIFGDTGTGKLAGLLCVHVDDVLWCGNGDA